LPAKPSERRRAPRPFARTWERKHPLRCNPCHGNPENALEALGMKIPLDLGLERSAKHPFDDLGPEPASRDGPATRLRHRLLPDEHQSLAFDCPGNADAAATAGKRSVFRSVGGKLMDSKADRLRRLVGETERRPFDLQPFWIFRPEGLHLYGNEFTQFHTCGTTGDQQVGRPGESVKALLE